MTVTQRISDESLFRGSIKKRHNNIRLKNKNKKKTRREQTRNKVQHWRWSIIDYTIRDSTHSLTTSSHWTQHGASDCYRFVIVRLFFSFHVCIQKCLFHRRGRPRSFKSIRKQFFFSYSFCENPNTPRAPHENLDHWKTMERGFLFFLVQKSKPSFQ